MVLYAFPFQGRSLSRSTLRCKTQPLRGSFKFVAGSHVAVFVVKPLSVLIARLPHEGLVSAKVDSHLTWQPTTLPWK